MLSSKVSYLCIDLLPSLFGAQWSNIVNLVLDRANQTSIKLILNSLKTARNNYILLTEIIFILIPGSLRPTILFWKLPELFFFIWRVERKTGTQDWRKSDGCFSPNLISSPWRRYEDYNISFCKQWKFALFTKGSKLPLKKGFKNMFELL